MSAKRQPDAEVRQRLLQGLAAAIAESGYAAATIHDIVGHASTSKRTFYEHFADKDACFLAAIRAASEQTLAALEGANVPGRSVEHQLRAGLRAFLTSIEGRAALTRAMLLEIHAAGAPALRLRREIHQRYAESLRRTVAMIRRDHPHVRMPSPLLASAVVGAINELLLVALERSRDASVRDIERTAMTLLLAVLGVDDDDEPS